MRHDFIGSKMFVDFYIWDFEDVGAPVDILSNIGDFL